MKRKLMLLALLGMTAFCCHAQVGIRVSVNRSTYMQFEPIYACVTLRNDTGKALLFGNDPRLQGFVLFDIRDRNNRRVPQRPGKELSVTGLMLGPGEIKRMVVRLDQYYDLARTGTYRVAAFVSHNYLPHEYQSSDQIINIEKGATVWTRTVGLPDLDGSGKESGQERTYSVRMLTDDLIRYYYLVIEDDKKVFGVMRVGRLVGREEFKVEIDMMSRIHLLVPIAPRVFHYLSFSLNGVCTENSYWRTSNTIPMLYRDPTTGKVTRLGGSEARPGVDFQDRSAGKVKMSRLLDDNGVEITPNRTIPKPAKDSGLVDLGAGLAK